ncbi:MAG: DUF1566 domain-containing protein, partial [Desulfosalsimonadaceae bacterium]
MGTQYYRMRFKQMTAIFCLVAVFLCLGEGPVLSSSMGTGNDYYVDIGVADDTGTGSIDNPWKTLHYAFGQLQPGDTLHVQPGTYNVGNGEDGGGMLTLYVGGIQLIGNGAAGEVIIDGTGAAYWYSGIRMYDELNGISGIVIENIDIRNFSENGIGLEGNVSNVLIRNCRIYQNAAAGVSLGGRGWNRIESSSIYDNGISGTPGAGIIAGSENNIISGNQVYWSGSALSPNFPQGVGVDITSPAGNNIHSNEVYGHTSGSLPAGVRVMGSYGTARIYDNRIHDNTTGVYAFESAPEIHRNLLKDNTTGIYVSYNYINSSPRIINNLITGATIVPSTTSIGINVTASPSGETPAVLIYHNTIYGAADRAIRSNVSGAGATPPEIRYNIISNTIWGYCIFQETDTQNPVIDYNLFYDGGSANYLGDYYIQGSGLQVLTGTNLTGQNPLFVDAPNDNCRLQTTSPAVDAVPAADHNKAVDEDFERVSRPQNVDYDMGCFEAFVFFSPTITWDGGPDGTGTSWSLPVNWSSDLVPGAADRVLIPSGFSVDMDADMPDNAILSIENHGTLTLLSGKTLIVGGTDSFATNAPDGILRGTGTLNVLGTDSPGGNYGTLAPGTSAGTLTITGGCRMDASARLEIEIGGTGPGMFDKLIVNGQLAAGGEIYVTLIDDYTPQLNHSFEIMAFTSRTGFFDPVILPPLPDGLIWRQTWNTGSLVLDVVASNAGGNGTEFAPYLIATPEQLNHVRKLPGKFFRQIANIDLAGYAQGLVGWDPIGSDGNCFTGSYDGDGYIISSLTIDRPSGEMLGLFGCVGPGGILRNISLNNVSINGYARIGAVAGDNSGFIEHCSVSGGSVSGVSTTGAHVGGLLGYNTGQVENCHAAAAVNGPENIGGLVGYHENGTISQSYAESTVTGVSSIGGLAGYVDSGKMINCFAAGSVTGTDNVGGFMGEGYTAYVTNCYAVGPVSGAASVGGLVGVKTYSTVTNSYYDSVTTGQSDTGQGEPRTTTEMKTGAPSGSIYTDWYTFVWDFEPTDAYPILRWTLQGQSTGWQHPNSIDDTVNTAPWPTGQIKPQAAMGGNGETLIVWAQYDGSYSRINKSEYRSGVWSGPEIISSAGIDAYSPQVAMDGNGNAVIVWEQSDGANTQIYKSEYRGGSWTHPADQSDHISLAGTDASGPQVAMAGSGDAVIVWQQSDGTNKQVYKYEYRSGAWTGLEAISPAGTDAASPQAAMDDNGVAVHADAVIVWQQNDGAYDLIYKSEYRGGSWVHPADLSDNISTAGIYAYSPQVAMAANGDAVIVWEQSGYYMELYMTEYRNMTVWSSPVMISPSGSGAGASNVAMNKTNGDTIIVWSQSEEYSYAKRIFMSEYRSGAWTHPLNRNDYISTAGNEADNAHAAMDGNGNAVIVWFSKGNGVYTGWISTMEYRAGVWKHPADIPPVGKLDTYMPNPYSPGVAMANNGDAVVAWDLYIGNDEFSFQPIWRVYKSEYRSGANPFAGGDGTELDPYQIETAAQLAAVKDYLDGYFILNADIDLGQPPWNDASGWEPIGTEIEPFAGHLDGNCKTINNLFIDRSGEDFVGLFGSVAPGAEVRNIALIDVDLTGRDAVGALAGKNEGEPISECLATGTVTGVGSSTGGVGGLVGYNAGGIADSYAAVHVTGTGQYIGGLVGKNSGGSITASYSSGKVTGDATAGGLAGVYDGTPDNVTDSYWNSETSGQDASEGGDPLTTAQMRQQSSFPIWDVSGLWGFVEDVSFPYLICHGQIQFTLTYTADANGSISGTTPQVLDHGVDGLPVSADPLPGFLFAGWSDGSIQNPRIDTAVSNINVIASFGPAPAPILNAFIPDTGQASCYNDTAIISCPGLGESFYGQDTHYQPQHPRSYTKLGLNGVALSETATQPQWLMTRDNVTGLIWAVKQDKDSLPNPANPNDADNMYTWDQSHTDFIDQLNAAPGFGKFLDWRLPTVKELTTLVDSGVLPVIDSGWFPNMMNYYWTDTDYHLVASGAWGVGFDGGYVAYTGKDAGVYAIAVREGPAGAPSAGLFADGMDAGRLIDNGDGTVTDTATGLMWQQETDPTGPANWQTALSSADELILAGHSDWRLPNRNELQTVVDYTRSNAAIGPVLFADTDPALYWSSTTNFASPDQAWRINFLDGGVDVVVKTDPYAFRAVRGGQFGNADTHISSPAQGGGYALGDPLPITWTPLGENPNVRILLSRDGGVTFEEIVASTEDDGDYEWLVAGLATANGMIRIEDADAPGVFQEAGFFALGEIVNLFVTTEGPGAVTSVPAGIGCGLDCVGVFPKDTMIQLSAVPDSGSVFTGWTNGTGSAAGCSGTGTCSFTITETSSTKANFVLSSIGSGTYYVNSVTGDDANEGSSGFPWQTLHHAIEQINSGTPGTASTPYILNVAAGEYKFISNLGYEPDTVLYITQSNLIIIGSGSTTIVDGTFASDPIWIDGFDIQSAANIVIRDLVVRNFFANGIHMGGAIGCTVEACTIYNNASNGISIEEGGVPFGPSSGNIIQNSCEIYGNQYIGIFIYKGSGNSVQNNCKIYHNGSSGIYILDSADNQIINNVGSIYDNGNSSEAGFGIHVYGSESIWNLIKQNAIYATDDSIYPQAVGVEISNAGSGNQVIGNTIYGHQETGGFNGFGIEVVNCSPDILKNRIYDNTEGVVVLAENSGNAAPNIWNNLIYENTATTDFTMDYGIVLEIENDGELSPEIYHNTIDGGEIDGIGILYDDSGYGSSVPRIEFNIISNFGNSGINNDSGYPDLNVDMNNIYNTGSTGDVYYLNFDSLPSGDNHDVPLYEGTGDYHLQEGSPCIDAIAVPDAPPHPVDDDLDDVSRYQGDGYDMGCYEAEASPSTYSISGTVYLSYLDAVFLSGVMISGLPGDPMTDSNGYYSAIVPNGWSGTAEPLKVGYTFVPSARPYSAVAGDQTDQDYAATLNTYTISGTVLLNGSGLSGVTISGLPGNPVTNSNGHYSVSVPHGWSGVAIPVKTGYTFAPAARTYTSISGNQAGQSYTAAPINITTYTISGTVLLNGSGLSGVTISGLPGNPVTDAEGGYTATVEYGWSGTATPGKAG